MRLGYTTTIDECVDAYDRMLKHLPLFRRQRSSHLWWMGGSFAAAMTMVALVSAEARLGLWVVAVAAVAAVLGCLFAVAYGRW